MNKPLVPRTLLDPVVGYFKPQRVILFGSRARGEAGPDSDIDLMVVVDDDTPLEKFTSKARHEARGGYRGATDLFPIRATVFEEDRNIIGTLAAEADIEGIVVYGPPKGKSPMRAPDPRVRWRAVERWIKVADNDRRTAALCMRADPPLRGSAAFHAQQAVEKLLKGFLTLAGKRSRKTHSLSQLGAEAELSFPELSGLLAAVDTWSSWVEDFRYPSNHPEPQDDELQRALGVIDELRRRLDTKRPPD